MDEGLVPNDPGWRPVVRKILPWVIVPGGIGRLSKDRDGQPPVFATRAVFVSFVMALVMLLVVLMFILPLSSGEDASTGVYLLLAGGPISVAFVPVGEAARVGWPRSWGSTMRCSGSSWRWPNGWFQRAHRLLDDLDPVGEQVWLGLRGG